MIDVLTGMAITAVVLGTAIPNLRGFTRPYALDSAARSIAADMSVARMRAIAQNRRHRVQVNADGGWWEVQRETAPGTFTVVGGRRTLPGGTSFGNVSGTPTFDTRGMLAATFSLDVSNGERKRTMSVNVLGDTSVGYAVAAAPSPPTL